MDLRSLILCLSAATLALTGYGYGWKFCRKGNYLIGIEWMILATSSSNAVYYFATMSPTSYAIAHFFDTFSRAWGVPIVVPMGLLMLTRGWKPSVRFDIAVFAISFVATFGLLAGGVVAQVLPYFLLAMSVGFAVFLAAFSLQLFRVGEAAHGAVMLTITASNLFIAVIYDFWKIPGEDTNVFFNFFTLALLTWSAMTVALYYAYCAYERAAAANRAQNSIGKAGLAGAQ